MPYFDKTPQKKQQIDEEAEEAKKKQILEEKAKRRALLRNYFQKQKSDPFRHAVGEGGTVLDPAIERYHSMQRNFYDHFKPSFKNALTGLVFILLPMSIYGYLIKTSRDNKEQQFRSGLVAYKDRIKKFV